MKTKTFLLFSTCLLVTSVFLLVLHAQQPRSLQGLVARTHQHIKDLQDNLQDEETKQLADAERYSRQLGMDGLTEPWTNVTLPVIVTYSSGDDHAEAVSFIQAAAKLPQTILLYNLGLSQHSLGVVSSYCNSTKCIIMEFDLSTFPSHVSDQSIHAYRPLIIQHALSVARGVVFAEAAWRWRAEAAALQRLWAGAARAHGVLAWPRRAAVTSLTHPRMFHYFRADTDDFLFLPMVDASRLLLAAGPRLADVMRPWVQCALTLDCIMPIGAQAGGCRFDKKPQYRYSGCHGRDASALSIALGLRFGLEDALYTYRGADPWARPEPAAAAPAAAAAAAPAA